MKSDTMLKVILYVIALVMISILSMSDMIMAILYLFALLSIILFDIKLTKDRYKEKKRK